MWPNPKYLLRNSPIHDPSIITILVGPEELPFRIHEKYAAQSRVFAAAFRGQFWVEARTRMMRLPETSTTFEIFVQGLYHKRLFSDNRDLEHELSSKFGALASREGDHQYRGFLTRSPETWPWRLLVSLYVLADYLGAQVVRIAAVDAMILRHEKSRLMTFEDIDFAFANTSPDSKLRSLLVHIITYDLDIGSTAREDLIGIPNEFLVDVSMTLSRRLPNRRCQSCYQSALSWVQQADAVPAHFHEPQVGPPWQTLNTCYYHEHSTEEEERDCAARVAREKVLERREQDRNRG
ncbi:MAG: Trehalase [Aureobasidium pullulans]|nr:MAG: Trehalase [Aureobasidium pullulans]